MLKVVSLYAIRIFLHIILPKCYEFRVTGKRMFLNSLLFSFSHLLLFSSSPLLLFPIFHYSIFPLYSLYSLLNA